MGRSRWTVDLEGLLSKEDRPKLFKSDRNLDAIGRLGGVEIDVGGLLSVGHGIGNVIFELSDATKHGTRCA